MADQEGTEDLDYHITFPSPVSQDLSNDEFEEISSGEQREPVVILLGWMGCQEKHLAKYSVIYEQRKCITIRYTAPTEQVFYKPETLKPIAVKILELIIDLNLEENPVFFHVFSNGGGYVYRYITDVITSDPQFSSVEVRGAILDSLPSKPRILVAAKALINSMKVNIILCYVIAFFWIIFTSGQTLLSNILGTKGSSTITLYKDYFNTMKSNRCPWPQLFLYSKGDKLVMYQDVYDVITARKEMGIKVYSKCWDDSDHVAHLRFHHEEYVKECYNFLDCCLKTD